MKRIVTIAVLVLLCFFFCACGGGQNSKDYSSIYEHIKQVLPDGGTVEVVKGGWLKINVDIPNSSDFSRFGNYVYSILDSTKDDIKDERSYEYTINFNTQDGKTTYYVRASEGENYCTAFDARQNPDKPKKIVCKTVDDLASEFPALKIRLKEIRALSSEEFAFYNEVSEEVNRRADIDESVIYEEIGAKYNMTGEEVHDLIRSYMDRIYG